MTIYESQSFTRCYADELLGWDCDATAEFTILFEEPTEDSQFAALMWEMALSGWVCRRDGRDICPDCFQKAAPGYRVVILRDQ